MIEQRSGNPADNGARACSLGMILGAACEDSCQRYGYKQSYDLFHTTSFFMFRFSFN
jgi:hypothetical protein